MWVRCLTHQIVSVFIPGYLYGSDDVQRNNGSMVYESAQIVGISND